MGSEWREILLKDACSKIGSGATPRGGNSVYLAEGDISLIRSQNVYNNSFDKKGIAFISEYHANELSNVTVEEDDILLNITGDSVARCCQIDNSILPARVNQHVAIIRTVPTILDAKYLRFCLVSPMMQNMMISMAGIGATRNALTKGMIENFVIPCPPLSEQKAIAHILGSLDDKIEVNRKMNATLEDMAQALFKSWFVDFDPVIDNAIIAGNEIPEEFAERAEFRRKILVDGTANREVAKMFPDSFRFTEEMGWIPEGWGIKKLEDVTSGLGRGISPKYTEDNGIKVINQRCIREHCIIWENVRLHDITKMNIEGRCIKKGDMLINSTGVGTLGRMAQVYNIEENIVTDSHVTVVRTNPEFYLPFVFGRMMFSIEPKVEAMGHGSTGQTELRRAELSALPVIIPPLQLQKQTEKILSEWASKRELLARQNDILANLRDTLLPKLISGELHVSEIETFMKEAGL